MESVWWVFKRLFDKGLVYRGFKVGCWCGARCMRRRDVANGGFWIGSDNTRGLTADCGSRGYQ